MASKFYRRLDALGHDKPASFKDIDKAPYQIRLFDKNTIEKVMQNAIIHQLRWL
jgi:hypothetical protein